MFTKSISSLFSEVNVIMSSYSSLGIFFSFFICYLILAKIYIKRKILGFIIENKYETVLFSISLYWEITKKYIFLTCFLFDKNSNIYKNSWVLQGFWEILKKKRPTFYDIGPQIILSFLTSISIVLLYPLYNISIEVSSTFKPLVILNV